MKLKIYTKTGDTGTTGYLGGRVSKYDAMIHLLGQLDELNAAIGLATIQAATTYRGNLNYIQKQLFCLGAYIADRDGKLPVCYPINNWTLQLETEIDMWEGELPELKNFILPGGSLQSAHIHLARAICRRVERIAVGYFAKHEQEMSKEILKYLNRLSDWLFTLSRWVNQSQGVEETTWSS
jgi:cob(I)alamin adenosyltransferase